MNQTIFDNYKQLTSALANHFILMSRMGDFYEMFFDHAEKAAPILGVAMTKRAGVPMCGIPYYSLELYARKLTERGFFVAVAELEETITPSSKLPVKRVIANVFTP